MALIKKKLKFAAQFLADGFRNHVKTITMAVKIRLKRRGRKKLAIFDVVIADGRSPRDGRFIEKIGTYNPNTDPASINLEEDKALKWLMDGAIPTDTVRAMLSYRGVMYRKHLQVGVNKGAITQEEADKKFEDWKKEKEAAIQAKSDRLADEKDKKKKERLAAEKKVSDERAEALLKKKAEAEKALAEEVKEVEEDPEGVAEMTEEVEDQSPATEETPAEESKEEAPAEEVKEEEPAEEVKEEAPAEEAKEEAPSEEAKEEAPAPVKEEESASEKVAEDKETPAETAEAPAEEAEEAKEGSEEEKKED